MKDIAALIAGLAAFGLFWLIFPNWSAKRTAGAAILLHVLILSVAYLLRA